MVTITVQQGNDDLGFTVCHNGIFDQEKPYESAVGSISLLRQTLMVFCDKLEENRRRQINALRQISRDLLLPPKVRAAAEHEFVMRIRGHCDDQGFPHEKDT